MCEIHVSGCQLAGSPLLKAQTTFVQDSPEVDVRIVVMYS